MQEVIIRTNYGKKIGLGHLYRNIKLADELKKKYKVTFALDKKTKILKKILNYNVIELYENSIFKNQTLDGNILKSKIKKKNIKFIIVDDYRLNFHWEKKFFNDYKIVVFDDLNKKKHKCHYIIDAKWSGKNTSKRYENLISKKCIKLLGPKYAIINKRLNKNKIKKNILIYFGGAGDFSKYYKLILQFCEGNKILKTKMKLDLIIGPMAYNYRKIINLSKKFKFLNIVINKIDISDYLNKCKFAFSSSSSIIYELNYLKTPSCLFSYTKNQENKMPDLEDLGFYFNVNLEKFKNSNNSKLLFTTLLTNFNKIKRLQEKRKIIIDNQGIKRIVNILNKKKSNITIKKSFKKVSKPKNGFFKINDNFINKYLEFRNMYENRKNSLNQSLIQKHNHYIWWFNNRNIIEKYYYYNKKILGLFYHQKIRINQLTYWYGGWMTGEINPKLFDIIHFLKFQIKISLINQNLPWIAIIKKKNRFVYLINKKLKFKNIKDKNLINNIKKKFNILEKNKYYFLIK